MQDYLKIHTISFDSTVSLRLIFTVVSEPPEDQQNDGEDCVEVGRAYIDLRAILAEGRDLVDSDVDGKFDLQTRNIMVVHNSVRMTCKVWQTNVKNYANLFLFQMVLLEILTSFLPNHILQLTPVVANSLGPSKLL